MPFARAFAVALALLACLLPAAARANPLLLIDAQTTEVLYARDAGQPWHPASLTKLMTAYVAFAAISAGRLDLDTPIKISRNAWNQAPSKSGLEVGTSVTLKDALYILIVKSANDIAVAIAEAVSGSEDKFVIEMNDMARAMGLSATRFVNPHGLHSPQQVSSARDLAVLSLYIRRDFPQYLPMFATEMVTLGTTKFESNNGLLTSFAGTTGMKTGYVCASGLNIVASIERGGRSYIAVVLGGASARERNEMAAEMVVNATGGRMQGTGVSVVALDNQSGQPAFNMRPQICGADSKAFAAEREAAYPYGLRGQPTFLTDEVRAAVYAATDLGKLVDVPLPRRRPDWAPTMAAALR